MLASDSIRYIYTATGQKLAQVVLDKGITKRTDYSGEYIYQNDTLQFINHEEGRVVMTDVDPEYQYHLKDHLGNVRVTFTTKEDIEENTATLETANAATEQSQFLYYDEAVKINSTLFDHTNNGVTQYSTRLSGSPNELTGLAKSISVMPGDTIRTEVYAKYLDGNTSNWTTALTNFMAAIAGGTAPEGTFVDGGATGSTGGTTPSFIGLLDKGDETGNAPKAYLNYLIFDKNYVLLNGGFVRMSENAREYGQDGAHEKLAAEFVITEPGYVYIYLSNDNAALGGSQTEVYFDDFSISQSKSPVLEENFYYPFGMIAQRNSREGMTEQSYLYNGKELQDELDLGWLDYGARMYDPACACFHTIDPKANEYYSWSPYNYTGGNPIKRVDINGENWRDVVAKVSSYVGSKVRSAALSIGVGLVKSIKSVFNRSEVALYGEVKASVSIGGQAAAKVSGVGLDGNGSDVELVGGKLGASTNEGISAEGNYLLKDGNVKTSAGVSIGAGVEGGYNLERVIDNKTNDVLEKTATITGGFGEGGIGVVAKTEVNENMVSGQTTTTVKDAAGGGVALGVGIVVRANVEIGVKVVTKKENENK